MNGHHQSEGHGEDRIAVSISELARAIVALVELANSNQAVLHRIAQLEGKVMSQITDWAAQEQADLTAISNTLDSIVSGIAALDALITQFQNSPGTLSAADQAALDGIQSAVKGLVTKSAAISTTPPAPPTTTTPPTP